MRAIISFIALFSLIATGARSAGPALVFQEGFETPGSQNPPAGWAMWGAEQYKDARNYTRDTTGAHGGVACFRIHHPAGTAGYICLAPDHALHPEAGMIYDVSFWARTRKAGRAVFSLTAYQSVRPFQGAGSPGRMDFAAAAEWKQYHFSMREGLDFQADECRYILLTFYATADKNEEQALWVDDIEVRAQKDPNPPGLIDAKTVQHEPLQHRLRPGGQLEFTVDGAQRLRDTTLDAGGVSFHRVAGWTGQPYNKKGAYTLRPELEQAIREMRLPMTRFYGVGDEPFSVESSIDKVAEMCGREGISQEHCILELETQSAATMLTPDVWRRAAEHARDRGYQFRFWEIANEPYSVLWGAHSAFPTPDAFAEHARAVSRAIRQAAPQAQIGFDFEARNTPWGNYLLRKLAGDYDFVAGHYYCHVNVLKMSFEELALTENYRLLDQVLRMSALLRAYNPKREVYQYDTEWGLMGDSPNGEEADLVDRNANIVGTLHRAIRLIYYAREGMLRGASSWQMLSSPRGQGFGILSQGAPDQRFMLYWLYYYFNRCVGETVLPLDGVAPYYEPQAKVDREHFSGPLTPVLATRSKDRKSLYLVIANGSWSRPVPCTAHLVNFAASRLTGVVLSNDKLDGKPLLERKEDLVADYPAKLEAGRVTCAIPPHAVVFLTLTQ